MANAGETIVPDANGNTGFESKGRPVLGIDGTGTLAYQGSGYKEPVQPFTPATVQPNFPAAETEGLPAPEKSS